MALTERLMVLLEGESGALVSAFDKAANAAGKVEQSAKGAKGSVDEVGSGADRTGGLLGKLGEKAGISGNALKVGLGAAAVAGIGLLGAAVEDSFRKFLDLAGGVEKFQLVSGASAEDASKLTNVMKELGVDPEQASKAFFKLGKEVAGGNTALAKYGVEVARNKDGSTNLVATLGNVAKAYQGTNDAATRDAIAAAAFGKTGSDLLKVLDLTDGQLKELAKHGPVFSQQDIDSARAAEISLKQAGLAVDTVKTKVGEIAAAGFNRFVYGLDIWKEDLHLAARGSADAAEAARKHAGAEGLVGDNAAKAAQKLEDEHKAMIDLQGGLLGTTDAAKALARSQQAVGDAERNVAEKRKALNELLAKGAVDTKAVDQATRSLEQANRSLATAQDRAAEAKKKLDAALAGPTATDLAGAQLDLKDATLGVADAQDNLTTAQQAVTDAQAAGDPVALAKANRDLEHANLDLEHATRNQAAAQQALNDLDPNSEAGSQRVADAYRGLADANQAVDDANRSVWDSTVALNTARAGDPDFADKLAAAYLGVRDANNGVADAMRGELGAILNLEEARYRQAALLGAGGDAASRLNDQLNHVAQIYPQLAPLLGGLLGATGGVQQDFASARIQNAGDPGITHHASGGRFRAGETSWVGERGPELVTFGGSGFVTPNNALGGGGDTINIHMPPGSDGDDVVAALRRYQQRNGRVPIAVTG